MIRPFSKSKYIISLMMLAFAVYSGSLYLESGSIISRVSLLLLLGVSTIYFLLALLLKHKKNLFFISWSLLIIINILGFFFTADWSNTVILNRFIGIIVALLGFYPFYFYAYKGKVDYREFILFLIAMFPIIILQYFHNQANYIENFNRENVVNNVSYHFVLLIPFLFFIRNKIVGLFLLALIFFFVIQGAKRGALLAASLGSIVFVYYILKSIKLSSKKKQIRLYFTVFSGLFLMVYLGYEYLFKNEFFLRRLEELSEGKTSGRTEIYSLIFEYWYTSESILNIIFGYGFASSLEITGKYFAHNDWLELLSNFGLIGISIYLFLILSVISYLRNKHLSPRNRMMLLSIVLIWLFMTMVSMWYTIYNTFMQAIVLGYICGNEALKKRYYYHKHSLDK